MLIAFDLFELNGETCASCRSALARRIKLKQEGQAALHPVRGASDRRRPDRVRSCLPHGAGGHRLEADGCALPQRAVEGVAQVEEPGERCGAPGARGGVALASAHRSLHGSAQMENPTKAIIATLRTIIAIAATSMLKTCLRSNAMMRYWAASGRPL